MPIPWTLQRYILRELGKTFLLAAIALTAVLGLGGGVRAMIKLGEVTPGQLLRIMALVLPLSAALTLPVATLFSAAATYGRLSGDNEFTACRSSGINLHVLLLPAVFLAVISGAITFCFINFVVPSMTRNLDEFLRGDVSVLLQHRLSDPKGLKLRRYRITADSTMMQESETERVMLRGVAFVEMGRDEWLRYGTADALNAEFSRTENGLRLSGTLNGLTYFDRSAGHFVNLAEQSLAAEELGSILTMRIKFLKLGELIHYWFHPEQWHEVTTAVKRARMAALAAAMSSHVWQDWSEDRTFTLADDRHSYRVRAAAAERAPGAAAIDLVDVTIEVLGARGKSFNAARATLEIARGETLEESGWQIDAYDVGALDGSELRRTKEVFGPVAAPPEMIHAVAAMSKNELLEFEASLAAEAARVDRKIGLAAQIGDTVRTVTATLHERMAFCLSVLVLAVLAASLGIILRGAHIVAAFGISFIPAIAVIVAIMMGKQLAQAAATHMVGLLVIWSGIAAVFAADWWVLRRVLRR